MGRIAIVGLIFAGFWVTGLTPAHADESMRPSPPQNLSVSTGASSGLLVQWEAPASPGGAPIEWYTIYRSYDGTTFTAIQVVAASQLSVEDDTADMAARVHYYVTATNSYGEGEASATVQHPAIYHCKVLVVALDGSLPKAHPECATGVMVSFQQ